MTNTTKKTKVGIFLMRGQIVTMAHVELINHLIDTYEAPLVLLGSSESSRSERNPFSFEERMSMLSGIFSDKIAIGGIPDYLYNDNRWVASVQKKAWEIYGDADFTIVGHDKDDTTFYLKMFPDWKLDLRPSAKVQVSATDVRNVYFSDKYTFEEVSDKISPYVSASVLRFLRAFRGSEKYKWLASEYAANAKSRDLWKDSPYTPTFNTTDAVVTQAGNILLVERKHFPGKGLLALPGGYLNPNESLVDGMIRELREETMLKVPVPVLKGSIVAEKTFADPKRSARGRILTHAFHIDLRPDMPLPKVKGSDDAFRAFWYPLWKIDPREMFEDHAAIISHFTRVI